MKKSTLDFPGAGIHSLSDGINQGFGVKLPPIHLLAHEAELNNHTHKVSRSVYSSASSTVYNYGAALYNLRQSRIYQVNTCAALAALSPNAKMSHLFQHAGETPGQSPLHAEGQGCITAWLQNFFA